MALVNINMDKYNHWIAKIIRFFNPSWTECAITIGQTTYFTCNADEVDAAWHAHEDEHKKQWARDGWVVFIFNYLRWSAMYGYENNPYETDARKAAGE